MVFQFAGLWWTIGGTLLTAWYGFRMVKHLTVRENYLELDLYSGDTFRLWSQNSEVFGMISAVFQTVTPQKATHWNL